MENLCIEKPFSGGILFSYKCTSECEHCMYASSPSWKNDWISEKDAGRILTELSGRIQESPFGPNRVGVNWGLHFTGGEPFLNFDLLLKLTRMADELRISSTFVETNSFWCTDDKITRRKLVELRDSVGWRAYQCKPVHIRPNSVRTDRKSRQDK